MLEIFFDVFSLVVLQPLSLPIVSEDPSQPWNLSAGLASKEPVLKLLSAGNDFQIIILFEIDIYRV